MIEHDVEQGSLEWHFLRAGRMTASRYAAVLTASWEVSKSHAARKATADRAVERITGAPLDMGDDGQGGWRGRGLRLERPAREWYELQTDNELRLVGFVTRDDSEHSPGCSPDAIVEGDPEGPGGLEVKSPSTKYQAYKLLKLEGVAPPAQIQASLWVTGLAWWDVLSWSGEPKLGPVLERVYPSEVIQRKLEAGAAVVEKRIERMRAALEAIGSGGRIHGSDLMAQLVASVAASKSSSDPDAITDPAEIDGMRADFAKAVALGALDREDVAAVWRDADEGNWEEVRKMWRHAQRAVEELTV